MAGEVEVLGLYGMLVDGGCHQHVDKPLAIVGQGALEGVQCSFSCLFGGLAQLHLHLVVHTGEDIQLLFLCLGGIVDDGKVGRAINSLAVIGRHLGRAIYDGDTEVQHGGVFKGFEDDLVAHSVHIAVGDAHSQFFAHSHIVY